MGRAIRLYSRREDIVVATKVHAKMHDGPSGSGVSRKAILDQLDASRVCAGTVVLVVSDVLAPVGSDVLVVDGAVLASL